MKSRKHATYVFILIGMVSFVFFANYIHYFNMDIAYVRNGILLNILAIAANICIGLSAIFATRYLEKEGYDCLLFVLSPLLFGILVLLLKTVGVSVIGCYWWLTFGVITIHYFQYVLYLLFIVMPIGIDGIIKKNFKCEKSLFSAITFINMLLLMFTKDLQGMVWYGVFSVLYYSYKRGIHILPTATIVISILSGVAYNLLTDKLFHIYKTSIDINANMFAYAYPLISLKHEFSIGAVILVIVLEILICCLLGSYVKKYVGIVYKQRASVLYIIMAGMWTIDIILDLLTIDILHYGSTPFATNQGFVYLVPIIIIFSLADKSNGGYRKCRRVERRD